MNDNSVPGIYSYVCRELADICAEYKFADCRSLGVSLYGKQLPVLCIGSGKTAVVYVSGIRADRISPVIATRFARELCSYIKQERRAYGMSCDYMFRNRKLYIVPMLNPDGETVALGKLAHDELYFELLKINGGNADFSGWERNGRGVRLSANFAGDISGAELSGEFPESEPETAALCSLIRSCGAKYVLEFTCGEASVAYSDENGCAPRSRANAVTASKITGFPIAPPNAPASCDLQGWLRDELRIPFVSVRCGNRDAGLANIVPAYAAVRRLLFCSPLLFAT